MSYKQAWVVAKDELETYREEREIKVFHFKWRDP